MPIKEIVNGTYNLQIYKLLLLSWIADFLLFLSFLGLSASGVRVHRPLLIRLIVNPSQNTYLELFLLSLWNRWLLLFLMSCTRYMSGPFIFMHLGSGSCFCRPLLTELLKRFHQILTSIMIEVQQIIPLFFVKFMVYNISNLSGICSFGGILRPLLSTAITNYSMYL